MKKLILAFILICASLSAWAQTTTLYSNSVTGNVGIGTTSPSQPLTVYGNIDASSGKGYLTEIPNGSSGTTVGLLSKIDASGKVISPLITDTDGVFGIVVGNAGTSGNGQIAVGGQASCVFDGTSIAGDFVSISNSVAGDCTDTGAARSTSRQTVGRVLTANAGGGTTSIVGINLAPIASASGTLTGGGTPNYLARWTPNGTTLGNSAIYDNGSQVSVGTNSVGSLFNVDGGVSIGSSFIGTAAPTDGALIQGNVGIGTSNVIATLDVASSVTVGNDPFLLLENTSGAITGTYGPSLIFNNHVSGVHPFILTEWQDARASFSINDEIAPYTQYLTITQSGNIGLTNEAPEHLLHVGNAGVSGIVAEFQNSSGACTHTPSASSEVVSCSSDIRFKKDVEDSESALAWLKDIRIRDFVIKATDEHATGVIAQEIESVHSDMVHKNAEGFYSVDQPNPWKLVKAIQEQQAEIDELKQTIEQLKRSSDLKE